MKLDISFKNMEPTDAIEDRIQKKSKHLNKYFNGDVEVHWTCSVEGSRHISDINAHAGKQVFHAHAEDENLYKSFDTALDKMERQLRRKNNKEKNRIHKIDRIDKIA